MNKCPELSFICPEHMLIRLATVLQSGFHVEAIEGDSISTLLLSIPGFTSEYVSDSVHTIFFNGDAIDDVGTLLYGPTATIALAGAMPGLAGAIVRKGSPWGALRKTMTVHEDSSAGAPVDVRIKLFNTIAVDRGAQLLTSSVRINSRDLVQFLELRPTLLQGFQDITLDGISLTPDTLGEAVSSSDQLWIKVQSS